MERIRRKRRWRRLPLYGGLVAGAVTLLALGAWRAAAPASDGVAADLTPEFDPASVVPVPEIPLEENAEVAKWIRRFTGGARPYFERWLAREGRYGAMIRAKLRARGLPEDLIYLAMIESGFSPRAHSAASASGMWQMMDATARRYGLRVDAFVDERRDPVRATDAALDYLEDLHREFGSWYLAAAAYNAGEGRVARALQAWSRREAGARDRDLFWEIMAELPPETREYVPMMIAAMIVARDPGRYGFEFEAAEPVRFERVFVPGGTALGRIAWLAGVSPEAIRRLNPHLILGVTPPGLSYPVRVPAGTAAAVVAGYGRVNPRLLALAAEALVAVGEEPLPLPAVPDAGAESGA